MRSIIFAACLVLAAALLACSPQPGDANEDAPSPTATVEVTPDPTSTPRPTSTPKPTTGEWVKSESIDPITDERMFGYALRADSGESVYGDDIVLAVRCKGTETDIFIDWQSFISTDEAIVTTRFDDGQPSPRGWSLSTDYTATFYPEMSNDSFLRKMAESERLVARVTPYSENALTAIFNLRGADVVVESIMETCG